MDVWVEDRESGERTKVNEAIYTFVAVDDTERPIQIAPITPESEIEKQRYDGALRSKQSYLIE
jgi:acyl-CoA hydrolase